MSAVMHLEKPLPKLDRVSACRLTSELEKDLGLFRHY